MKIDIDEAKLNNFPVTCNCGGTGKWLYTYIEGLLVSVNCLDCGRSPLESLTLKSVKFPKKRVHTNP